MNKALFYFVMVVLTITNIVCLLFGAKDEPTKYLGVLIVALVITNLSLATAEGWGIQGFLGLLAATFIGLWLTGLLNTILSSQVPQTNALSMVYGIRWGSLIWPIAVIAMGGMHLEKLEKEKKKE